MPKLPRVSGMAVLRALESFERLRQSGSHVMMRRGSSSCVVPMHNEVKVGTLVGILRQANVTPEEFISAL
ncbi:MAG: type II toxin-antitoxin system HicA family toxin [Azonexus sp.]|jgi:predicted RNA binding protein YcfA (HicA-like mRNA interferase family)|uniref:type II toxin-antitoxin system HicA family toxin n=1 Tax=Azonexus sp. TaxID=1872668 RepID=UPI002822A99E|nr:type II toxin-antitoxin system HicA family toxin [Azonexus sp.]MDR0777401.1 type II toxin-antitoxin system HicA family toxin [Azonexus sp.]